MITTEFRVVVRDTPETLPDGLTPQKAVQMLALRKAEAVARGCPGDLVIGADTVVALDRRILGKPQSAQDAFHMLKTLSGRQHCVYTGVALAGGGDPAVFCEETRVWFRPLSDDEIRGYIATGEPMDKAGAYGIQGGGALFIPKIQGDYYNVMGLPVCRLAAELQQRR